MTDLKHSITFINYSNHRCISYDNPHRIDFLNDGAVKVRCDDGFQTILKPDEWECIEIERYEDEQRDS